MTQQLEKITKAIINIDTSTIAAKKWKESTEEGKIIRVLFEIKESLKANRHLAINIIGEDLEQMITEFNPVTEAEKQIGDMILLYKQPRTSRNFSAIRSIIADAELLYKMAEL